MMLCRARTLFSALSLPLTSKCTISRRACSLFLQPPSTTSVFVSEQTLRYMGLLPTLLDINGKYDWGQTTFLFDKAV